MREGGSWKAEGGRREKRARVQVRYKGSGRREAPTNDLLASLPWGETEFFFARTVIRSRGQTAWRCARFAVGQRCKSGEGKLKWSGCVRARASDMLEVTMRTLQPSAFPQWRSGLVQLQQSHLNHHPRPGRHLRGGSGWLAGGLAQACARSSEVLCCWGLACRYGSGRDGV